TRPEIRRQPEARTPLRRAPAVNGGDAVGRRRRERRLPSPRPLPQRTRPVGCLLETRLHGGVALRGVHVRQGVLGDIAALPPVIVPVLHERVGTQPAVQEVGRAVMAAVEVVVTVTAIQTIEAGATAQGVVAGTAGQGVVAGAAVEDVIAPVAVQGVVAVTTAAGVAA